MKIHYLKTIQPYFEEVRKGNKQFEVRRNDRNFNVGDLVVLQEFIDGTLTGNTIDCGAITYVLKDFPALQDGFVVFGFNKPTRPAQATFGGDIFDKMKDKETHYMPAFKNYGERVWFNKGMTEGFEIAKCELNKEKRMQRALAIVQQVCDLTCAMMKDQATPQQDVIKEAEACVKGDSPISIEIIKRYDGNYCTCPDELYINNGNHCKMCLLSNFNRK